MNTSDFRTLVNKTTSINITKNQLEEIDLEDVGNGNFHLLYKQKSYKLELISQDIDQRNYVMRLDGTNYSVDIKNELDSLIEQMGYSSSSSKASNSIIAPMPGILLDVMVLEDSVVEKDQPLLILEAMKMENVILSPKKGLVKSVHVQPGDTVEKNKLLIELADSN